MTIAVNVRGACGAGKSTLVKEIMLRVKDFAEIYRDGRKKPMGYRSVDRNLFIPGHYEIQNGGMDTIGYLNVAYALLREHHERGHNLLFEGMNQKRDYGHLAALKKHVDLRIVMLLPPLATCRAGFAAKGQSRVTDYVGATWRKANEEIDMLRRQGYDVKKFEDRAEALVHVKEILL